MTLSVAMGDGLFVDRQLNTAVLSDLLNTQRLEPAGDSSIATDSDTDTENPSGPAVLENPLRRDISAESLSTRRLASGLRISAPQSTILEAALVDALAVPGVLVDAAPVEPPAVDPRGFSLVVIGGARVAAVGNATTAGVLLRNPQQSTENNL